MTTAMPLRLASRADLYRVPTVVARIYDPRRGDLYRELGIVTVAGSRWASNQIYLLLHRREFEPDLIFGGGETILLRAELPATLHGRRVRDLAIEGEIHVVEINSSRPVHPSGFGHHFPRRRLRQLRRRIRIRWSPARLPRPRDRG